MPEENHQTPQTPLSFGVFTNTWTGAVNTELLHLPIELNGNFDACNLLAQKINNILIEKIEATTSFPLDGLEVFVPSCDVDGGIYIKSDNFTGFRQHGDSEIDRDARSRWDSEVSSAEAICSWLNELQITVDVAEFADTIRTL